MEDLTELLQFTVSGIFPRGDVNNFSTFLGYKDIIEISPTETIQNPIDRITFIQNWVKETLMTKMAESSIKTQEDILKSQFETQLLGVQSFILNNIGQSITTTAEVLPPPIPNP